MENETKTNEYDNSLKELRSLVVEVERQNKKLQKAKESLYEGIHDAEKTVLRLKHKLGL